MPMKRSQMRRGDSQLKRSRMVPGRKRMKSRGTPEAGSVRDLENQLDELVRKVLPLSESVCFTDGRPGTQNDPLEVSHLFGRAQRPTRFDVHPDGNNHLQHHSCNSKHNDDKSIYQNAFIERHGEEAYREIETRAHQGGVFEYTELLRMILQRESML